MLRGSSSSRAGGSGRAGGSSSSGSRYHGGAGSSNSGAGSSMAGGSSHGAGSSSGGAGKRDDEPPVEFTDDMMELLCMQRPPVAQNKNSFTIASETLKIAYLKGTLTFDGYRHKCDQINDAYRNLAAEEEHSVNSGRQTSYAARCRTTNALVKLCRELNLPDIHWMQKFEDLRAQDAAQTVTMTQVGPGRTPAKETAPSHSQPQNNNKRTHEATNTKPADKQNEDKSEKQSEKRPRVDNNKQKKVADEPEEEEEDDEEEDEEFLVEQILGHRIDPVDGKIKFLVRWEGYGEADDTWEPREGLRHLDVFKEYDKEYKDELKELAQLAKSMKKSRTPGKRK